MDKSMDRKSKLIEEFVRLKRLIKKHENKESIPAHRDLNNEANRSRPTIHVNPIKLNSVHNDSTLKVTGKASNHQDTSKLVSKVFINPNFRKSDLSSYNKTLVPLKPQLKREEQQKQIRPVIEKKQISFLQHEHNACTKVSSGAVLLPQRSISPSDHCRVSKLPVQVTKTHNSNNRVIFFNPEFSSPSKLHTQNGNFSSQNISRTIVIKEHDHHIKNLCSETKTTEEKLGVNVCRRRKVSLSGDKRIESSTNDQKRRKVTESIDLTVKKIFVNPKFDSKVNSQPPNIAKTCDHLIGENISIVPSTSGTQYVGVQGTSMIPVLLDRKEVPRKFTSLSYPMCAIGGPVREKQVAKKTTTQRIRTRSTSLITISTTKLVRNRKPSQRATETRGNVSSQPLFVTKTKLVRNVGKKIVNSSSIAKVKIKQLNQKTQTQYLLAEKLYKLRRKSFTDGTDKIASIVPKSAVVTKIRSKNGRSLKLVRKTAPSSLPSTSTESKKSHNPVINRKMELKKQSSRIAMCLVQNKLRRNQFSKINVPVKVSHSPSYNRNVYKKNNIVCRKPLTKAALVGKKETTSAVTKTQIRNTSLDMTKFIKSKYRLIKKQSNTINRYKLSRKFMSKTTPYDKLVQRKKLKWKRKSDASKRQLTRKDLRIKKIGGVFYRYSRTTLAKNKPICKTVPQLQNKSLYHITTERKQNRFCFDKTSRRRQASFSGVSFITSPSGMSWRRTNDGSAKSILAQAKQKSIYLLSKKLKKNNEPCLFFHRYGRCSGHERGLCVRLHDKKYLAVCKKFVQASCTDAQCSLSHKPSCHNMPTCHHFLAGQCGRDNCPYPHIKVSDSAPICLDFLKGYCSLGDQCTKRHIEICPSFEKGICARGKYCPYPHPKNKTGENLKGRFKHIKRKPQPPKETESVSTPSLRYFEDVNLQKENEIHQNENREGSEEESEVEVEDNACLKRRPQLGELPSFIPLSQSFVAQDT